MIRLIQRRLIIPRGDTGTFSIPVLAGKNSGDASIFTIFNPLTHRKIFEKVMEMSDGVLTLNFTHGDTVNLPVGDYMWDIKFYADPETITVDGVEHVVGGTEVDSYYAAFQLPVCEIRETGDNLLMADDAPDSALAPSQLNYIEGSKAEIQANKEDAAASATSAASSASEAGSSAANAGQFAVSALDSKNAAASSQAAAEAAATAAAASAAEATAKAAEVLAEIPTKVSDLENDAGYLTEHQDISGKANSADLAAVATSGSYDDLSDKPTIPDIQINGTSIIDNGIANIPIASSGVPGVVGIDSLGGITVGFNNNLEIHPASNADIKSGNQYLKPIVPSRQDRAVFYGLATAAGADESASQEAFGTYREPAKAAIRNMIGAAAVSDIPDISGKANTADLAAVATSGSYNDLLNKPTNVSAFTNDAGYLISFTETDPTVPAWAKASTKPTYTAAEVGAPTVAEMNTAIGTAIGNINSFDMVIVQQLPSQNISTHTIYLVPKTGETNDVYDEYVYINNAWEMIGNTQIDLSNYVQKTDYANTTTAGIVKINSTYGLTADANGTIGIAKASDYYIKEGTNGFMPVVPSKTHVAAFYGLAKAAGDTTQAQSENAVGTYTTEAKAAIRSMIGAAASADVSVQDVTVSGISIVNNGVANIPPATEGTIGIVAINSPFGVTLDRGALAINKATATEIKTGTNENKPIVPSTEHNAVFYGLAKAAGDSSQASSSNSIGTYTDGAKSAIRSMIGAAASEDINVSDVRIDGTSILSNGIADIPIASANELGVVKITASTGITIEANSHYLRTARASSTQIKTGTDEFRPIVPEKQHEAAFYGLAKAAGDTTQSQSDNAIGTYTDEAKTAIQSMLGFVSTDDLPTFATDLETQAIITEWEASV